MTSGSGSSRLRLALLLAITGLIGGLALVALYRGLHDISYRELVASLCSLPAASLAAAVCLTAISFVVLFGNDLAALRYARAAPPLRAVMLASLCGYAVGNVIGFGALSGGAVRFRVYAAAGVSAGAVARVALFIAAAFGIGAAETIAVGLALRAQEIADLYALPCAALRAVAGIVFGLTAVFLILCAVERRPLRWGKLSIELPRVGLALAQIGITAIDLAFAASALWVLLPVTGIDFPIFLLVYVGALCLGVASHAPGGIGVFDAALLYAVGTTASPSAVAAALVAYRAIYFGLPFALAAALLTCIEIRRSLRRA